VLRCSVCRPIARPSRSQYKVFVAMVFYTCSACLSGGKLYLFEVRFDRRPRISLSGALRCNGVLLGYSLLG